MDRFELLRRRRVEAGLVLSPATLGLHSEAHIWHGVHPLDDLAGLASWQADFLVPLSRAFSGLAQDYDILIAGRFDGADWTASCGHYRGVWAENFLGIPATGEPAHLRFGRFERWAEGHIVETYEIVDLAGLMMQAKVWPMAPGLGTPLDSPPPASGDGVVLAAADPAESAATLKLTEDMIAALLAYDGHDFESMHMLDYWSSDMAWYGPAGIGTMRGYEDYRRGHGRPFVESFPDRRGAMHKSRIAERSYAASAGWPSVEATHMGGLFMAMPATHKKVQMRVMDFWRAEHGKLAENWVYIDIIHLLRQVGVDVFDRMERMYCGGDRPTRL